MNTIVFCTHALYVVLCSVLSPVLFYVAQCVIMHKDPVSFHHVLPKLYMAEMKTKVEFSVRFISCNEIAFSQ